jgi:hypothetical protein
MSLLFALVASACAAVVAALLVHTWRDEDLAVTTVVALVLLPVLILTIIAWREAL